MFNERKAAQVATWFLRQNSGSMAHLKLIKLMYLAEREAMHKYGVLITGDRFVSMDQGPVPSSTLSFLNGEKRNGDDGWDKWISDKADHQVALVDRAKTASLDELSAAEIEVLGDVWQRFGQMGKWALVDYLHDAKNCPEWKDPEGSSLPIPYAQIFQAFGRSPDDAALLAERIEEQRQIDRVLSSI